jgi:hypothetical protein
MSSSFLPTLPPPFFLCCVPLKMGLSQVTGKPEVMPPGWQIAPDKRAAGQEIEDRIMLSPRQLEAAFHGEKQTQTNP